MKNTNSKKTTALNIAEVIRAGGATLNSNGEAVNFNNGYQVSKKDCYKLEVKNIDKITISVEKLLNGLKRGDFVGIWVDGGYIYIDISERIHNLKRALRVGKARKQISIFKWSDATCIYC